VTVLFLRPMQSFTSMEMCTVKKADILKAIAKQIKKETDRQLNDQELTNIATMIRMWNFIKRSAS